MSEQRDMPFKSGLVRPEKAILGCVAVPIVADDIAANLGELFALWADPRFAPVQQADTPRPHLMIMVNRASEEQLGEIQALYKGFAPLSASFSGCSALSAELDGARDLYAPDGGAEGPTFGRKAGPNFLFQQVIERGGAFGGFTLQLELDCLPVGAGWVEAVGAVIADHPRAWVIGSQYAGAGLLGADAKTHLNGNALYRAGDARFKAFFDQVWMPRLLHQIGARPDLAYDWWWSVERFEADARANNTSWQLFQTYDSFFHADPYIVNLAVPEGEVQAYARVYERFVGLGCAPVFLHGPAMNAVRRALLAHPQSDIFDVLARLDPTGANDTDGLGRIPSVRQAKTLPPEHLLVQAAADLLNPARNRGLASTKRPDTAQAQAISDARAALAKDHPARVHFDRVRAHVRGR